MAALIIYTDEEIAVLTAERKSLPVNWQQRMRLMPKESQSERQLDLTGDSMNEYCLILRRNSINLSDFSLVLAVRLESPRRLFRLRRYNGNSHRHRNRIEGNRIDGFHIHIATERYQARGMKEDGFAEPTDRYFDFESVRMCLFRDVNVELPSNQQHQLW